MELSKQLSAERKKVNDVNTHLDKVQSEPFDELTQTRDIVPSTIEAHFACILDKLGVPFTPGTQDTPRRYAKFLREMLKPQEFEFTIFDEPADEMVIVNGIEVASLCEHHTLPFFGKASVAYIPNGKKIVGLSKLPRLVHQYCVGFQNQERITQGIGKFLTEHQELQPKAVGVVIECSHTCMSVRGVREHAATTRTQFLSGVFKTDLRAHDEFWRAVKI
jgi:GTP cyclohydrolase IA